MKSYEFCLHSAAGNRNGKKNGSMDSMAWPFLAILPAATMSMTSMGEGPKVQCWREHQTDIEGGPASP